ncbi:MAG: pyridoxamine 5'-phosphate oxidase family protein [Actinomycetota bacterium]|nr:pyridoxamine 5'-phosphate oxidase family protein [Actinomycetota bacterium]
MSTTTKPPGPSARSTVKRLPERASYDSDVVHAILDEGYVCHIGVVIDGSPVVIPSLYARDGDSVLIHGSPASRTLRTAGADGVEICLTVTLVDGFVIARSGFHHSMNYRSVVIFGNAAPITDDDERARALDHLVDTLVPGQAAAVRPMTRNEMKGTTVLRLPITEASAKVRTGGPVDDAADYDLPIWAGVLPVTTTYGPAIPDAELRHDLPVPDNIANYRRNR